MIIIYSMINIAMVTAAGPVVGVPLPLVSFGGSNMLSLMVSPVPAMSAHAHRGERLGVACANLR